MNLITSVQSVARVLGRVEEDSRLTPILLNIEKQYTGNNYGAERKGSSDDVFADDVEMVMKIEWTGLLIHST